MGNWVFEELRGAAVRRAPNEADTLRRDWGVVMGRTRDENEKQGRRRERRDIGRLASGLRTVKKASHVPVLQALVDLGGSATIAEVLENVRERMTTEL